MFITKFLQIAFPAYLICVYMVLCHNTAESLSEHTLRRDITRKYSLNLPCSGKYVEIKGNKPTAYSLNKTNFTHLEVISRPQGDVRVAVTIMGLSTKKYICFNKCGRLISKFHWKDSSCLFNETMTGGYTEFHLLDNPSFKLGFNKKGKALQARSNLDNTRCSNRHGKASHKPHSEKCYQFMKMGEETPIKPNASPPGPPGSSDQYAQSVQSKVPVGQQDVAIRHQEHQRKRKVPKNRDRRRRSRTTRKPAVLPSASVPRYPDLAVPVENILVRIRREEDPGLLRTLRLLKLMA